MTTEPTKLFKDVFMLFPEEFENDEYPLGAKLQIFSPVTGVTIMETTSRQILSMNMQYYVFFLKETQAEKTEFALTLTGYPCLFRTGMEEKTIEDIREKFPSRKDG